MVELLGFFAALSIAAIIISRLAAPIAKIIGFAILGLVTVLFLARSTLVENLPPFLNFFFADSPQPELSQPFGTQNGGTTTQPGISPTPVPTTDPAQTAPQFEGQQLPPSPPPGPRDLPSQPLTSPQAPIRARW